MVASKRPWLKSQDRATSVPALMDLVFYCILNAVFANGFYTSHTPSTLCNRVGKIMANLHFPVRKKNKLDPFYFPKEYTMLMEAFVNM